MPKHQTRLTMTKEFTVFRRQFCSCTGVEACHYQQSPQVEGTHTVHFHTGCTSTYTPVTSETFSTLALSSFRVTFATVVTDTLLNTVWSKPPLWTSLCADHTLCRTTRKNQRRSRERNNCISLYVHHWKNWNETPKLLSGGITIMLFLCK